MTDLSPEARAIIDAGRHGDGAGDIERARVRRELMAKIAAGTAMLGASSAAAGGSSTGSLTLAKILLPIVLVAGGVGGTLAWRAHKQPAPVAPPAPVAAAPAPVVAPTIVPVPTVAPPPAAEPVRHAPPHHAHVAARAETSADHLAEETALLASANAQLRAGDARRALSLLDDYDHRYPGGVLREEVLATRVIARCQIGLEPDAASRRAADTFLRRHPTTPLASRVRSSCTR